MKASKSWSPPEMAKRRQIPDGQGVAQKGSNELKDAIPFMNYPGY